MIIITFGALKGGVGKTMLCFNLGAILSQKGFRVLIVDSDLQGNLTNNMGADRMRPDLVTLYDIYDPDQPQATPEELVLRAPHDQFPGLDLVAGSIFLHRAELYLSTLPGKERILGQYFQEHRAFFAAYDYILIDTNPSMSIINQNAFAVSDSIVLISDVSMNALEGIQLFMALWEESRLRLGLSDNVRALVINDFDGRNRLSNDFLEYLRTDPQMEDLRLILMDTVIPRTVRITESELAATPISIYDRSSKGCLALLALTEELQRKNIF